MADEPKNSFYNLSFYDRLLKIRLSNREIVSNWLYLIHHLFFSCVCPVRIFFTFFLRRLSYHRISNEKSRKNKIESITYS